VVGQQTATGRGDHERRGGEDDAGSANSSTPHGAQPYGACQPSRGSPPSASASAPSRAATPGGPSTIRSARSATAATSDDPLATVRPGIPLRRKVSTASKAGKSPRSSPM